jgi:hypothetical protein
METVFMRHPAFPVSYHQRLLPALEHGMHMLLGVFVSHHTALTIMRNFAA